MMMMVVMAVMMMIVIVMLTKMMMHHARIKGAMAFCEYGGVSKLNGIGDILKAHN